MVLVLTDDLWVNFNYKDQLFRIDSFFVDFSIAPDPENCPNELFEEVITHIENYKSAWPHQWLFGAMKYAVLLKKPANKSLKHGAPPVDGP